MDPHLGDSQWGRPLVGVALMEKPLFELPPWPDADLPVLLRPAAQGETYLEPFLTLAKRLGLQHLFVVQETQARVIPSSRALSQAVTLSRLMQAKWFFCTHESTLGTTPSEVEHARAQVAATGARLQFLVPVPWGGSRPTRSCAERLNEHLAWTGWAKSVLAVVLGLPLEQLQAYLTGRLQPSKEQIDTWAQVLGLSPCWLAGESPFPRWSDEVRAVGRQVASAVSAQPWRGPDDRMRMIIKLAGGHGALFRSAWFFPGVLGIDFLEYPRFVRKHSEASAVMRERLCAALDLSLTWLEEGGEEADPNESPFAEAVVYQISLENNNRREAVR